MAAPLKVLMPFDIPYKVPRDYDYAEEFANPDGHYTENDVWQALLENGYEVRRLGLFNDIRPLLEEVETFKPDVIFNLVDHFNEVTQWDKNIAALYEILQIPYTGATAAALHLCNDKALGKKILRYHRVRTPRFHTFYRGQKVFLPATIKLPCIVKPLNEEASRGISKASVAKDEKALIDRVTMIHESMKQDAIVEEYIDGRELYVSIIGDQQLRMLPPREMHFGRWPEGEPRIATYKAKWDDAYRERWGITDNTFAEDIDKDLQDQLAEVCKRAYRALNIRSYARFDLRITPKGRVYVIEPNVNPCIARNDEFAQSAARAGIDYPALIRRIVRQALKERD